MSDILGSGAPAALQRALDIAAYREQLVASNVANIDTPGYRTKEIDFKAELRRAAIESADGVVEPSRVGSTLHEPDTGRLRGDGNNVDIDREMIQLGATAGFYAASVEMIKKYVAMMRAAITDGRP